MKAHSGGYVVNAPLSVRRTDRSGISVRVNGEGRAMIDVRQFRRSVPVMDVWEYVKR